MNKTTIRAWMMLAMTLNHISYIFLDYRKPLPRLMVGVGYSVAFVMCYFLAEGFCHTSSKKRYAGRLLLFALISQAPFYLAFSEAGIAKPWNLNMMFTLLFSFLMLWSMETFRGKPYAAIAAALFVCLTIVSDWALMAPLFVLFYYRAYRSGRPVREPFAMCLLLFLANELAAVPLQPVNILLDLTGPLIAFLFLSAYEKNPVKSRSGSSRWFFYVYYPLHLLILWGCSRFIT